LGIAAVEIVRKNRENRAEKKLKHGSPLFGLRERSPAVATADRRACRPAPAAALRRHPERFQATASPPPLPVSFPRQFSRLNQRYGPERSQDRERQSRQAAAPPPRKHVCA